MVETLLRTNKEIVEIWQRHNQTVYRVCFAYLKNPADTEDLVQDTFYKLITAKKPFENSEHEKAWLITTATNLCKNKLKYWWNKHEDLDDYPQASAPVINQDNKVLDIVMKLPDKYKTVVYLYYYEGYDSAEIAKILKKPQSTIRNHLSEARKLLRKVLGDE